MWKDLCGRVEEGVLEKYKFDETMKEAYRRRGEPFIWHIVKKEKRYQPGKWREDCWARTFHGRHGKNDETNAGKGGTGRAKQLVG